MCRVSASNEPNQYESERDLFDLVSFGHTCECVVLFYEWVESLRLRCANPSRNKWRP